MIIRNHTLTILISFLIIILLSLLTCKSSEEIVAPKVEVGQGFLKDLPMNVEDFIYFANIGWVPGKIFPCDHGGFLLADITKQVPVFSPADMTITRIMATVQTQWGYTDYALTLSVNQDEFQVIIGHMSALHKDIQAIVAAYGDVECDTLISLDKMFIHCLMWVNIPVSAGDTLGMAGSNPGQNGLDFGTYDKTRKIEFATDRFDGYLYPYTVSPLDYFTEEICAILIPICGFSLCNGEFTVRTVPPVGGTVDFDIPGTAQGIWFKVGEPFSPVDPHMALVYHNVDPSVPIFSIGTGLPDLDEGSYTFTIADTGYVDRPFHEVKPDGHMYRYNVWYHCSTALSMRAVLLLQMTDETHLKIEKQDVDTGPPWEFTENAVLYDR
jgi:hypothetical protein